MWVWIAVAIVTILFIGYTARRQRHAGGGSINDAKNKAYRDTSGQSDGMS